MALSHDIFRSADYRYRVLSGGEAAVGSKRIALIDAAEYERLQETAHLLRSPCNAERLWLALDQARRGEGLAMSVEELRREVLGGTCDR